MKDVLNKIIDLIHPMYYDRKSLSFKRLNGWFMLLVIVISSISFIAGWIFSSKNEIKKLKEYEAQEEIVIIKNGDKFSEEKLILFLEELNVKFPEIIYAQARLESNSFQSKLFKENNNLFGMRNSDFRPNLQTEIRNTYGVYNSWRQSVEDYIIFYCCYLKNLQTKEQYYDYIEKHYSETIGYSERVRNIEKEYFSKLEKLKGKNSYDVFNLDTLKIK